MKFADYRYLVSSDLYRRSAKAGRLTFLLQFIIGEEGFKYTFWMRTCAFCKSHLITKISLFPIARLVLRHYTYKFGISISYRTKIGCGFYIGHFGGIVVHPCSVIGNNCNISQGVTLGQANRGRNKGYPTLGNNVYVGPGAKIVGAVNIGNNVAIGANCVVTRDIPDNSVVVGIPGKVISQNGAAGYIDNTDYECKIS